MAPRVLGERLRIDPPSISTSVLKQFTHMAALVSTLVVLAHANGQPRPDVKPAFLLSAYAFFDGAMSIIRMPTFFFLSGFLFMHTNPPLKQLNYATFVWKKIIRLILPYLVFTSIAFPIKAYLGHRALRPVSFTMSDYILSLCDPMRNPVMFYWFLVALFIMFLTAPLLRRILLVELTPLIAVTSLALLALRWTADRVIPTNLFALQEAGSGLFFFWAGMIAWLWRDMWTSRLHPRVALLGILAVLAYYIFAQNVLYIRFVVVLLGIYSVYCFIGIYMQRGWKFLRLVDGKTYQIYLMAWFPQQFVIVFLYKQFHLNYWLCSLLMFTGGIYLPLLATWLVKQYAPSLGLLIGLRNRPIPTISLEPQSQMETSLVPS